MVEAPPPMLAFATRQAVTDVRHGAHTARLSGADRRGEVLARMLAVQHALGPLLTGRPVSQHH